MLRKIFAGFLAFSFLLVAQVAFAAPNFEEGQWEITSQVHMPQMPMAIPPVKHTQCITKKDMVPQKKEKGQECKITKQKITGDTVSWSMQCTGEGGTMNGEGKITYQKDKFDGSFHMTMNHPQQGKMEVDQKMSGKRLGPCPKK